MSARTGLLFLGAPAVPEAGVELPILAPVDGALELAIDTLA
jgi:hypothetical protein